MIIEQISTHINKLSQAEKENRDIEIVFLQSDDLVKRIQLVKTNRGRELGIRLNKQKDLTDGDVLYLDDQIMIVVEVLPDHVLVIRPQTIKQTGEIAYQLGNRHVPAQFEEDMILIQYDYLIEDLLKKLDIPFIQEHRKVKQAFRHIGHHHHD
jgi:urease accessory protein